MKRSESCGSSYIGNLVVTKTRPLFYVAIIMAVLLPGVIHADLLVGYSFPSPDATATQPTTDPVDDGITPSNFDCTAGPIRCDTSQVLGFTNRASRTLGYNNSPTLNDECRIFTLDLYPGLVIAPTQITFDYAHGQGGSTVRPTDFQVFVNGEAVGDPATDSAHKESEFKTADIDLSGTGHFAGSIEFQICMARSFDDWDAPNLAFIGFIDNVDVYGDVVPPRPVPAMSKLGMVLLGLLLSVAVVVRIRGFGTEA